MATHSRLQPRRGGAWGVSAIGATLVVGALAYGSRQLTTSPVSVYPTVETLLLVGLGGTVLGTGYWLERSDLTDGDLWRIAVWVSLGIILLVGLTMWQLLTQVRGGATVRDPLLTMVVTQTVGATAGLLVGIYHVQSLRNARAAESAVAAAQQAQAAQDQLTFVHTLVRHHLRNGMHVIQSYVRHLEPHVDGDGRPHLRTIEQRSRRLVRLVDEMRPLAAAIDPDEQLESTDVTALVEHEAAHFQVTHPETAIEFEPADSAPTVQADSLLSAAIETLLRGAIERSGVRGPTVTVAVRDDTDRCRVSIEASGPVVDGGIDRRFRTDGATDDGWDADLNVARQVLERYDGALTVDTAAAGPRFLVDLPCDADGPSRP